MRTIFWDGEVVNKEAKLENSEKINTSYFLYELLPIKFSEWI